MQSFNSAAYASISKRNGATSLHQTYIPCVSSPLPVAWGSGPNINDPGQCLSDDLMCSHAFAQGVWHQCRMTVPTGCHSNSENSLPFHSKATDSEEFYYPPQPQDLTPSTAYDNLNHAYVWSNTDFPRFDLGEVTSRPLTELSLAMNPSEVSSQCAYHVCHWIENDVHCGQPISGVTHELSTHLRDAHNIQGNEKRILVCRWLDCGQKLQRGGMKRHVVTRHLNNKSHCYHCSKAFSRQDAMKKHARSCQGV